jgi:hypothetical protein
MEITVYNKNNLRRLSPEIRLEPGANLVDADALALLRESNKHVAELFNRGILRTADAPKANKDLKPNMVVSDLSELKPSEAIKAVEACKDVNQLKRWSELEPRKSVKAALVKQYHSIVNPIDDSKD